MRLPRGRHHSEWPRPTRRAASWHGTGRSGGSSRRTCAYSWHRQGTRPPRDGRPVPTRCSFPKTPSANQAQPLANSQVGARRVSGATCPAEGTRVPETGLKAEPAHPGLHGASVSPWVRGTESHANGPSGTGVTAAHVSCAPAPPPVSGSTPALKKAIRKTGRDSRTWWAWALSVLSDSILSS